MNWRFYAMLAAGMLESAGIAKEMEDDNDTGKDDLIGEGLIFVAKAIKWYLGGMQGTKPTIPSSLK